MTLIAAIYVIATLGLLNMSWASPAKFTLIPRFKDSLITRLGEWGWRLAFIFYIGFLIDTHYSNAPHQFYTEWALWLTFLITCACFTLPGYLYWRYKNKKGA